MNCTDVGIIFFNPETVAHKKLPPLTTEVIYKAFQRKELEVFHSTKQLEDRILAMDCENTVFAFMSSGNFGGIDLRRMADDVL
jgi:UDP-N-acetylmuramate: L-alanyl-gamma-D-glutamyl-meso-diaminopimelate ligase